MKNKDITEWLLDQEIDPLMLIAKKIYLSDLLEKHLKEQIAIFKNRSIDGMDILNKDLE